MPRLLAKLVCSLLLLPGALAAQDRTVLSFYGTPGLIDTPTAAPLPDGELAFTTSYFGDTSRNSLTFQVSPRLSGTFRYSAIQGFDGGDTRFDRSFDLRYQLSFETQRRPAIAVGLQDFGGSGIYSGEFIVATKHFTPRFATTLGIGWGRYGSRNGFTNPLGVIDNRFETRPDNQLSIEETGRVEAEKWFRGDAAFFGGVQWRATDKLSFLAEYSSDAYTREQNAGAGRYPSPLNFGVNYQFDNGVDLGAYYLYGTDIGVLLNYSFNGKNPPFPGGREGAPPPIVPRNSVAAASWGENWRDTAGRAERVEQSAAQAFAAQGLVLEGLAFTANRAQATLRNPTYDRFAQALGRAVRALANTLPPEIEVFEITIAEAGVPLSRAVFNRSDLEELEFALDGAWQTYARSEISDAYAGAPRSPGVYPRFSYNFGTYLQPSLFDPDNPIRADFGPELSVSYLPAPGLVFAGSVRQPLIGNLDQATRMSNSQLPRVRSDLVLYNTESELELSYLTGEKLFRPGKNLYGRVTAGYLERMYGGVSGELLWKPVNKRLALGAEINYARQRDFDMLLGFQDYDVITGHASAYYDFGNGYLAQIDAGRYLAGDWGATFSLDREFGNGMRVGAFFTLTDVPFDEFGEGSFDKGIRITVPISWLAGEPTRRGFGQVIRPVTRDGGARLDVRNRLYEFTRGAHGHELEEGWGKFWR